MVRKDFEYLLSKLDVLQNRLEHNDPIGPGSQWLLATTAADAKYLALQIRHAVFEVDNGS